MPRDHGSRGCEPTKRRVSNYASKLVHWWVSEKRSQNATNEALRQAVEQSDCWSSQQNQRSRYRHQEKMLRHMGREQMMIHSGERRSHCGPQRKQSTHKSCKPPRGEHVGKNFPNLTPAPQVDQ